MKELERNYEDRLTIQEKKYKKKVSEYKNKIEEYKDKIRELMDSFQRPITLEPSTEK